MIMKNIHEGDKLNRGQHKQKSAAPLKVSDAYYVGLIVLIVCLIIY